MNAHSPGVLFDRSVAELVAKILAQGGGGGVGTGPRQTSASVTWIMTGHIHRWMCFHCVCITGTKIYV